MDPYVFARKLRRNHTDAERQLWAVIRNHGLGPKFRRQRPLLGYIVDFVCLEQRLVIEIDGGQHFDSVEDRERDQTLQQSGYRVLRFWNNEVLKEFPGVVERIRMEITCDT